MAIRNGRLARRLQPGRALLASFYLVRQFNRALLHVAREGKESLNLMNELNLLDLAVSDAP
ncbi:hypothetical protein [Sinorhizobium meliloti]|uniref:hypothetical protein n=1 Tax=Rhizobium meliloti TaxID=382 RepID=UPI000FE051E6|nr:hypothetical protein [Sinorhizobium meliloti]RVL63494.1 hypothetical protein CN141_06370 [Sinorhizobium meliloti]